MRKQILIFIPALMVFFAGCKTTKVQEEAPELFRYNMNGTGPELDIVFKKGEEHNHPLMAIWTEDLEGNFLQTVYVAESIGKGVFKHGDSSTGRWLPGKIRRPAALPVWAHRRGVKADDGLYIPSPNNPVADAYTGATPGSDFRLNVRLDSITPDRFKVFFEINQSWDWNEYWTNNKYPDNDEYKTSCQPALIYQADINLNSGKNEFPFEVIGHAHYAGETGKINEDLSTMTTALQIAREIKVLVKEY